MIKLNGYLLVLFVLVMLSGCVAEPVTSQKLHPPSKDVFVGENLRDLLPPEDSYRDADQYVRKGIEGLMKGHYDKASQNFNQALRSEPQNSYIHFLNGLSYHLMADTGNPNQYEPARIGYELALKIDSSNWLATRQLAKLHLKLMHYVQAQKYFTQSILLKPDNAELFFGLAQASYSANDLETAIGAIRRARELNPNDPQVLRASAIIAATSGDIKEAREYLRDFRQNESNPIRIVRVEDEISHWERTHASLRADQSFVSTPTKGVPKADEHRADNGLSSRMAVIDVVIVRTEEYATSQKGLNLLEGLTLSLDGSLGHVRTTNNSTTTREQTLTKKISLPTVTYNLNIFNAVGDRSEIIARPTLTVLDGKESSFFSGAILNVNTTSTFDSDLKEISAGVTLTVTPEFISDDTLTLKVFAKRSFFEKKNVGTFNQAVRTSDNQVKANVEMKFNQTLILSGLQEKQTNETKNGTPLLGDIPIIQYLFSSETTTDFHKSLLIMLTPRRIMPGLNQSTSSSDEGEDLYRKIAKDFHNQYPELFDIDPNIVHIMKELNSDGNYKELRSMSIGSSDASLWWGTPQNLDIILKRALSFLYY